MCRKIQTTNRHRAINATDCTRRLPLTLGVNVAIQSGGWLRVVVLWMGMVMPIAGYGFDDCQPLQTGGLDVVVQWQGKDLSCTGGKKGYFRFAFSGLPNYLHFRVASGSATEEEVI